MEFISTGMSFEMDFFKERNYIYTHIYIPHTQTLIYSLTSKTVKKGATLQSQKHRFHMRERGGRVLVVWRGEEGGGVKYLHINRTDNGLREVK